MLLTEAYPSDEELKMLTFAPERDLGADLGALVHVGNSVFSESAWQALAAAVAAERTLTPFPAHVLRDRWERGHAAALAVDGEILAYVSCAPIFDSITRGLLLYDWGPDAELPPIDVYESLTGWTAPVVRKHGVSLALRRHLLGRVEGPNTLFIGFTAGTGASPVLSKLGWQVLPWREISYTGSLVENSTVDCTRGVLNGWRVEGLRPYDGPGPLTFGGEHDWGAFCHFWVSKPDLARRLDAALSRLNARDLCLWREKWARVVERVLLERGWVPIVLGE